MANEKKSGIFAAVGAATGLGNAFRFPALCVSYGGAFIIAYAVSLAVVCFPLLCAELYFGKKFRGKGARAWAVILRVAAANSALIALYYGVILTKLTSAGVSYAVFGTATGGGIALTATVLAAVCACVYLILRGGARALSVTGKLSVTISLAMFLLLAAAGVTLGRVGVNFSFLPLAGGAIWADALGQSLLALSLAAGVMPTFARTVGQISVKKCAITIIFANFCGCMLAVLSTLPFVSTFPQSGGVSCALEVYPQVVEALCTCGPAKRAFGAAIFAVLSVVAIHSLSSLATPAVNFFKKRFAFAPLVFCISAAALYPLFTAYGMQVLSACDRMACSVTAVLIAFAECAFFAWRRDIRGVIGFLIRFLCPAVCLMLAVFSLCSARFGCFSPVAAACAFTYFISVAACATVPTKFFLKLTYPAKCDKIRGR